MLLLLSVYLNIGFLIIIIFGIKDKNIFISDTILIPLFWPFIILLGFIYHLMGKFFDFLDRL